MQFRSIQLMLWLVCLVGCDARTSQQMADAFAYETANFAIGAVAHAGRQAAYRMIYDQ